VKKINTANAVCGALIVALTMTAYLPVWHAGFIWDDDSHLTENPCIVGPLGFGDIWTSRRAVYYPLVLTTFWIFHKIFGLNPLPYHFVNVIFRATIQGNPACWMAHSNLGRTLLRKGKVDEAILHCQRALQIKPDYAEARSNLGFAFLQKGQVDEAISNYRKALKIKPAYAGTQNNLGNAFLLKGRVDEAIACYQRAIEIEPGYAEAHGDLCLSFLQKGELDKALAQCDIALQMKPALVETLSAGTRALELTRKVEGREFFVPINQRLEIYRRQHAYSQPGE
jgi:Flp pilus assembly protein TadD